VSVLIIAPHPDDEALGCGGAVANHTDRGERVAVAFLTSGELGLRTLPQAEARRVREREAEEAAGVLGVSALHFLRQPDWLVGDGIAEAARALRPLLADAAPHTIYLPHPGEWHPDHRAALLVLRAAHASGGRPAALRLYEVWTPLSTYDHVEDVSTAMPRKLRAVRCHRSQLASFRYDRAVRGLNAYRGALTARCAYAEVYALGHLDAADAGREPVHPPTA
jgi:LmbE family N-acetylglucosaminyl deacetylase